MGKKIPHKKIVQKTDDRCKYDVVGYAAGNKQITPVECGNANLNLRI